MYCFKVLPKREGVEGNNQQYCNKKCRNKRTYLKRGGAEAQRAYLDKRRALDTREKIQCLVCGKYYRQVGSHIVQIHGITAREYREEYGFDVKKGQLPEDYRELKAEQAVERGGAKNLLHGKKFWFKKGQKGVGVYKRSKQTMERLKNMRQLYKKKKYSDKGLTAYGKWLFDTFIRNSKNRKRDDDGNLIVKRGGGKK